MSLTITMMRKLFIGIPVESEIVAQAAKTWWNDRMLNRNRFNWVKPENWHITLYFLGNTPESEITLLQKLIEDSFASVEAFSTLVSGTGVFPHLRNPKVLWLGLEDLQLLMPAYARLGDLLRQNGFNIDSKSLKPHLTLARIKSLDFYSSFEYFLDQNRQLTFGSVEISRVVLYESITTPRGPVYKPLFVKALETGQNDSTRLVS